MTANPADAVREALDELIHFAYEDGRDGDEQQSARVKAARAKVEDRLAALAGAAPVAWSRTDTINDASGCPIGMDEPRVVWGAEHPDPEDFGWHPLYNAPHAPAKAREVTEEAVTRAQFAYDRAMAHASPLSCRTVGIRAALATFAEGA